MNLLIQYGMFLLKLITVILLTASVCMVLVNVTKKKYVKKRYLQVNRLNDKYHRMKEELALAKMNVYERKQWFKNKKIEEKKQNKIAKKFFLNKNLPKPSKRPTLYVIDFQGSIHASGVSALREEISAIISVALPNDKVLLRLESSGGSVNGYGLAAAQLQRFRTAGLKLIIAIDQVAASGGYMMACVANYIVAAPFAIVGSIGVVAQIPNFSKLLKNNNIDVETHTSGKYKRTLTLFSKNTEEGRQKFCENLQETHTLFKLFVHEMRPNLNIENVATGEYWYGRQALSKGLIDLISTSDEVIIKYVAKFTILRVRYITEQSFCDKILSTLNTSIKKFL